MSLPAIVVVHNRYQRTGGEDAAFEQEAALLEARGHRVERVEVSNDAVAELPRHRVATSLFWSRSAAARIREAVERTGAAIAHFHNTLPLVSPAGYYGARAGGAAVVQTLHNYRLICPGTLLLRDGRPCEDCVGRAAAWPAALHGCYRGSRTESAGVAAMVAVHRLLGTWERRVDAYIALGSFPRARFVKGGLPADRLHVRPNFLGADPGIGPHEGDYALFVGRLSEEKGVRVLVDAWRGLDAPIPLRIIGEGELDEGTVGAAPGVEWLGPRPRNEVLEAMKEARVLVFPSLCYENSPMTVVEAFATGLPIVASRTGSLPTLVDHERTGVLFEPGSARSLRQAVRRCWQDPAGLRTMGAAARAEYERTYTVERGYASLMDVYAQARAHYEGSRDG